MKRINKIILFAGLLIAVVAFGSFKDNNFKIAKSLDIYFNLFKELNFYYVDSVDPEKLVKTSIDQMLESLDPYTTYIPESELADFKFQTTGQYGGIGALIRKNLETAVISEPYENFPAYKAGVKAGDIILEIDGKTAKNKNISDISDLLKGVPGTEVELKISRPGLDKPITKKIIRERITIPNVPYFGVISDSIGYIRLTNFTSNAGDEVRNAVKALKKQNSKKIILDLRNNPGGLLNEAVEVSNVFLPKNQLIVSTKGKVKEVCRDYFTENNPEDTIIPLVVLVNRGSASASEIVTGALQDLDRALIIGQRTFGKGLVQQTKPLGYNTQLKVTIAKYYIPSGRCIQALDYTHRNDDGSVGYIPDSLITAFKTRDGRTVFNGGGIQPDSKTEIEKLSNIAYALYAKNLIFDFATIFSNKQQSIPGPTKFQISDSIYSEFKKYIADKEYDYTTKTEENLKTLISSAKSEKYYSQAETEFDKLKNLITHDKDKDLETFKKEIKSLLQEEIISRYYYQKGRIEVSLLDDPEIKRAKDIFRSGAYKMILTGETEKVIGKASNQND
jgi:carboxyl-terminal processing protease